MAERAPKSPSKALFGMPFSAFPSPSLKRCMVLLLLGGTVLLSHRAGGQSYDAAGVFTSPQSAQLYLEMGKIENQLYGHPYEDQGISARLTRVERTLFGLQQNGTQESRFARIEEKIRQQADAQHNANQGPMLEYLEQKFFLRTFPNLPFEQRVHQLELQVFGKSFDRYPMEIRLKKLTYTIPLMAKEIRLTKGGTGTVIATSAKRKAIAPALVPSIQQSEPEFSIADDDFFDNIFRLPNTKILRWTTLPVQVYIEAGSKEERELVQQAVSRWNAVFPIKTIPTDTNADILVDWNNAVVPSSPLSQPILHLDQQKSIRTVVLVNMTPYKSLTNNLKLRAALHQLGHAAGAWGHSGNPQDVMYPVNRWESFDIPQRWNLHPVAPSKASPAEAGDSAPTTPTLRDRNTMLQIYSHPAQDIRTYSVN